MDLASPLAIIPARCGSKGIPGKNLRQVGGVSLLVRSIQSVQDCLPGGRVFVSTDSTEYVEEAKAAGAHVIERPAELASDEASSEAALLHALDQIEVIEEGLPEVFFFLQCTSPLLRSADLTKAYNLLWEREADVVFSGTPFYHFLWKKDQKDSWTGINHDPMIRERRQDREQQVLENGAFYLMRTKGFRSSCHRFFGKVVPYLMPPERSLEIDSPSDLLMAETMANYLDRLAKIDKLPDKPKALVLDFDGVLTDNRVVTDQRGEESVVCDRADGMGLELLRNQTDLEVAVFSKERNPVVDARCAKLGIPCFSARDDKLGALKTWLQERGIRAADCCFVGNDVNDRECMEAVGCGVAVADAHLEVLPSANLVLANKGGQGAVREICDLLRQKLGND